MDFLPTGTQIISWAAFLCLWIIVCGALGILFGVASYFIDRLELLLWPEADERDRAMEQWKGRR